MDRRTLLAITLCFLIFMGWQKFYIEPRFPARNQVENQAPKTQDSNLVGSPVAQTAPSGSTSTPEVHKAQPVRPSVHLPIQTSTGKAILSDTGSFLAGWTLKNYKTGITSNSPAVDLQFLTHQAGALNLAFDDARFAYLNQVQGQLVANPQGAEWTYEDENVKLTREMFSSETKPYMDMRVTAQFKTHVPRYAFVSLSAQGMEKDPEAQDHQLIYWTNQAIERVQLKDTITQKEIAKSVQYIGVTSRYFVMAAVAQDQTQPSGLIQPTGQNAGRMSLVYPVTGNTLTLPLRVYFGPKELDLLRQVNPALDHTIDFGWFTLFAYPLLKILKWLYQFVQNYGLAIIFLTLLLKVATYPLTYKSMKSMKKMAKLQPQLQRIRDRYKDDKEALNREMLILMKNHGYNPMAGCLPMLIQMPVFFALYRVLYSSIELYHAPFALWIYDLSSKDPYYVTPVLLSLTMFIQQKLTPNTATDPAQAKMMQMMPLIFGAFMLALPSGLTIYMLVNAIASIGQQIILNKKFDTAPASG